MKKTPISISVLGFFALLAAAIPGRGQAPSTAAAPGTPDVGPTPRTAIVVSPEVHPDGTVTFRLRDFGPRSVRVTLEGAPAALPMTRNSQGVWETTTGPLAPDFYGYSFEAGGVSLVDPANGSVKEGMLGSSSLLHVPGPPSLPWEAGDVPHGVVHRHFYHSGVIGDQRDYYVYTPPGYDRGVGRRYPVLYLCHGYTDDASAWVQVGRANFILDHLIASGRARPMLVVMPLGYGLPEIVVRGSGITWDDEAARARNTSLFRQSLLSELIPRVESEYRAEAAGEARAIAGLSMGGTESLLIGLNDPARFAWVGSFSAGALPEDFASDFPALGGAADGRLRLLWIACGSNDPRIGLHRGLNAWLDRKGIRHTAVEVPGGAHTWLVWRRNLAAFAPLLFDGPLYPKPPRP